MMLDFRMLGRASRTAFAGAALALALASLSYVRAEGSPAVAAAASLRPVLDGLAKSFETAKGQGVRITYGATGNLVHQIEAGAPFQILFAADDESVKKLTVGSPGTELEFAL